METTYFMGQGWLKVEDAGLVDNNDGILWNAYIILLKSSNITLNNNEDVLVWVFSKDGIYSPKDGYIQLIKEKEGIEQVWWWRAVWKFKCPFKNKIFMCFLLSNKSLTWDVLRRKGREGPGRCYLCKE